MEVSTVKTSGLMIEKPHNYFDTKFLWQLTVYLVLVIGALMVLFPLVWALIASVKSYTEIFNNPLGLPREIVWQNFIQVFEAVPFHLYFLNTLKITAACR